MRYASGLKIINHFVSLGEVPDEINLCVAIHGCPRRCDGCFWSGQNYTHLEDLDELLMHDLIDRNDGATCVCFLGGDWNLPCLKPLVDICRQSELKVAIYSGDSVSSMDKYVESLRPDYLKIGPYVPACGGLANPGTNQRFFKLTDGKYADITNVFHRKGI